MRTAVALVLLLAVSAVVSGKQIVDKHRKQVWQACAACAQTSHAPRGTRTSPRPHRLVLVRPMFMSEGRIIQSEQRAGSWLGPTQQLALPPARSPPVAGHNPNGTCKHQVKRGEDLWKVRITSECEAGDSCLQLHDCSELPAQGTCPQGCNSWLLALSLGQPARPGQLPRPRVCCPPH